MMGGQFTKAVRRFGIGGVAILFSVSDDIKEKKKFKNKIKYIGFLLTIPLLSMGYGANSWLMKIFKSDAKVRIAYATLLALPFWVFGWAHFLVALASLIGAFQVRAGGFKIGPSYDFLYEDLVRYMILGINLSWGIYG